MRYFAVQLASSLRKKKEREKKFEKKENLGGSFSRISNQHDGIRRGNHRGENRHPTTNDSGSQADAIMEMANYFRANESMKVT
jgi:hypothetical protein